MIPLGIINHSPDYILTRLRKRLNIRHSEAFVVSTELPADRAKLIVFLSIPAFKANLEILNSKKYDNTVCCVFGSPLDLHNLNVTPFDYQLSSDIHLDAFQFTPFDLTALTTKVTVKWQKRDFLIEVLDKVQSFNGILMQLMTFIYTMPYSTHQKPIKEMACQWLVSAETEEGLQERIRKACIITPMTDKQITRLKTILLSPTALLYKKALQATAHLTLLQLNTSEFTKIVTAQQVSPYEIRYIRNITK